MVPSCATGKCVLLCVAFAASITGHALAGAGFNTTGVWAAFIKDSKHAVCKDCNQLKSLRWLQDYTKWHAKQLKNADKAKFLLYTCGPPSWEGCGSLNASINIYNCAGTGDRLRGMVEMLRQAAYAKRVLLFHWSHPLSLERVLVPTAIDWRVKSEYKLNVTDAPFINWDYAMAQPVALKEGTWKEQYQKAKLVIMRTAQQDSGGVLYPYWPHFSSTEERSCAYKALFKPSQMVEKKATDILQRLLGTATQPYVAVHLRMGEGAKDPAVQGTQEYEVHPLVHLQDSIGKHTVSVESWHGVVAQCEGMQGETRAIERFEHSKGLLSALVCVRAMAEAVNSTKLPVLLITDNELLRNLVAAQTFKGVTGPPADVLPAHLNAARDASEESHISSFVDIVLLARAAGLLRSPSGFSNIAFFLGRSQYSTTVPKCIDALGKKPKQGLEKWLLDMGAQQTHPR